MEQQRTTTAGGGDAYPEMEIDISLIGLILATLRRARILVLTPLIVVGLVVIGWLVMPKRFMAESSFLPQTAETSVSGVSSIAAQFGIALPTGAAGESLDFYVDLLNSPVLLHQLLRSEYDLVVDDGETQLQGTLLELGVFDLDDAETQADSMRKATSQLKNRVVVSADAESGLVRLKTIAPWPALAVEMNRRLVDYVSEFNLERRQSRAAAELEFVEGRRDEAIREMEEAEAELQRFLESNRTYQTSPQLTFEFSRLQRRVTLQQDVYGMLAQAAEQARIERVRDTPVITTVDPPGSIIAPSGAGLKVRIMLGLVLGLVLGFALAVIVEFVERLRAERPAQLAALGGAFRSASRQLTPRFLRRKAVD